MSEIHNHITYPEELKPCPFCGKRPYWYLKGRDDNLNPILREIFADGFEFYGVKENHPNELININHYSEYESIL